MCGAGKIYKISQCKLDQDTINAWERKGQVLKNVAYIKSDSLMIPAEIYGCKAVLHPTGTPHFWTIQDLIKSSKF